MFMVNIGKKLKRKLLGKLKHKSLILTTGSTLVFGACNTNVKQKPLKTRAINEVKNDESIKSNPRMRDIRMKIANSSFFSYKNGDEDSSILNFLAQDAYKKIHDVLNDVKLFSDDKAKAIKNIIIEFLVGDRKEVKGPSFMNYYVEKSQLENKGINLHTVGVSKTGQGFIKNQTYDDIYCLSEYDCANIKEFLYAFLEKAPKSIVKEIEKEVMPEYNKSIEAVKERKKIFGKRGIYFGIGVATFVAAALLTTAVLFFSLGAGLVMIPMFLVPLGGYFFAKSRNETYTEFRSKHESANIKKATIGTTLEVIGNKKEEYTSKDWINSIRNQLSEKMTVTKGFAT